MFVRLLLWMLWLVVLGTIPTHCTDESENYENCVSDFSNLEQALLNTHRNEFILRTKFFPAHVDNPLYVTVNYNFSSGSVDYIWSAANLYLTVHPRIISYLSLFFSYVEANRVIHLELQLPEQCSDLANNTNLDETDFLFILTHRLRYYAQKSSDLEDLEAKVVAAEKRKQHHRSESVGIFFSLVIGLPFAVLVLVWVSVCGAFPYIRILINDPENFPSVAALYWIGQTFTLFVIVMDLHALSENSAVDVNNSLSSYQLVFLWFITVVEIIGLLINLLLALVPLISHAKNVAFKSFFECYSKLYLIILLLSFKYIGRKEARIWLFLSSLVVPIIALSSHAGFIIGGWVSYEDRSVAILLLYLFVFIFLYWSLQNIYRFSTFAVNYTLRKAHCSSSKHTRHDIIESMDVETGHHHEEELSANVQFTKHVGFDSIAVFVMVILLLFLYGTIFYVGLGLAIPLLSSIDQALIHIFNIGKFALIITAFLLTYTALGAGAVTQRLVSNEALRYWRFLRNNNPQKSHIAALTSAMDRLLLTLKAFNDNDRVMYTALLKRKKFDMTVVADKFDSAITQGTADTMPLQISNVSEAAGRLKAITDVEVVDLKNFERPLSPVQAWVKRLSHEGINENDKDAVKKVCAGVNHFRKTLATVLGVPPMYLKKDKASALTASLIYEKISTSKPDGDERLSLLLSLIEEEF